MIFLQNVVFLQVNNDHYLIDISVMTSYPWLHNRKVPKSFKNLLLVLNGYFSQNFHEKLSCCSCVKHKMSGVHRPI